MWAAGIIAFKLIYNEHPLEQYTSSVSSMRKSLSNYREINFPARDDVSV